MRRVLCLLLCLALVGANVMAGSAEFEVLEGYEQPNVEDLLEVTLKIHSNVSRMAELEGLYFDNVFYIDYKGICELTGSKVFEQDSERVIFSMHGGQRRITVTDDCRLQEAFGKHSFSMDIPTATCSGKLYISAAHILRYMGAQVSFAVDADATTHMSVSMPYTVLDLKYEYEEADGYTFHWSDAPGWFLDPQTLQYLYVIDTIYWEYDSHLVLQSISEEYSELVMEDMYRDVLMDVVLVSGAELVEEESPTLQLFGDVTKSIWVTESWIECVMDALESDWVKDFVRDLLAKSEYAFAKDAVGVTKTFVKLTNGVASALETIKQYCAVSGSQLYLLKMTMNRVTPDSAYYNLSPIAFNAAQRAQVMIEDANEAAEYKGKRILLDLAVDLITAKIPVVNTVAAVTEIFTESMKESEQLQEILTLEKSVTFAVVSNTISVISRAILGSDVAKLSIHSSQAKTSQSHVKADILLALKSGIITRQRLIESDMVEIQAVNSMQMKNQRAAELLNKAENAQIIQAMDIPEVSEDLTWIAKLAGKGRMGMAVNDGKFTYYWQFDGTAYETGAYLGRFSSNSLANLVRVDRKGREEVLFTTNASKFVVTSTQIFYNESDMIASRNLDGSNYRVWIAGTICAVDPYGQYLIYKDGESFYSMNTWNGETAWLFEDGSYEGCHMGVVYYAMPAEYESSQNGKVILRAVNIDGTDDRLMATTPADFGSESIYSGASIQKMYFHDLGVYFSYGCFAGTGSFFQGARIVRVSYDGTQMDVIAGKPTMVDATFGVNEDGSVVTTNDRGGVYYNDVDNYYVWNESVYWINPKTGFSQELLNWNRFSSDVSAQEFYVEWVDVWNDTAYFMVNFGDLDPEQAFGWREYAVRVKSIIYRYDIKKDELTQIYSF